MDHMEDFVIENGVLKRYTETGGDVVVPESVTEIAQYAFAGCEGLTSVTFPESVTRLDKRIFNVNRGLKTLILSAGIAHIEPYALKGCENLTCIAVPAGSEYFCDVNGVLFNRQRTELVSYPSGLTGSFAVPAGVKKIRDYAFEYCKALTGVSFPEGLTEIGTSAFYECKGLSAVSVPNSVKTIGRCAFYACSGLRDVTLPDGLTEIGEYAFYYADITGITIPESVARIGKHAFKDNRNLSEITLPDALTAIEAETFKNCVSLSDVRFPSKLVSIGEEAFRGTSLITVELPDTVTEIGNGAFSACRHLQSVALPEGIRTIPFLAFESCSELMYVSLSAGLSEIGYRAFQSCEWLTEIELPESLKAIRNNAFFGCRNLKKLVLPDSIEEISPDAFGNCPELDPEAAPGSRNEAVRSFIQGWEAQKASQKDRVTLCCPTCGQIRRSPVALHGEGSFPGVKAAAYNGCVRWGSEQPAEGSVQAVDVSYPFFCKIGDCFHFAWHDDCVEAKLLKIVSTEKSSAVIKAKILSVRNGRSFAKTISKAERNKLADQGVYRYLPPTGDHPDFGVRVQDGVMAFSNGYGGGDVIYEDCIFTDEDGVDHLIRTNYRDFEGSYSFFGDQILGLRKNSPYQWHGGLLIDRNRKAVIHCAAGVTEAVIPTETVSIGRYVFLRKESLKCITIPAGIREIGNTLDPGSCPNLKTFRIQKGLPDRIVERLRKSFPDAVFTDF